MVENTDQAIAKACKITDSEIVDYTVPDFYDWQGKRRTWMDDWIQKKPADIALFQSTGQY
jgi:hypothetical protein